MKKSISIVLILFCAFTLHSQCLNMDVVIVGDYSGSVHKHEDFVLDAIQEFVVNVEGDNVRTSVIFFSDNPTSISELTSNKARLLMSLEKQRTEVASGGTNIEAALQLATNVLLADQKNNSRKLIILISDGDTNSGDNSPAQSLATAHQINSIGIGICAVLIKSESQRPEFMREISGGCYAESSYENLAAELKDLDICL